MHIQSKVNTNAQGQKKKKKSDTFQHFLIIICRLLFSYSSNVLRNGTIHINIENIFTNYWSSDAVYIVSARILDLEADVSGKAVNNALLIHLRIQLSMTQT